MLVAAVAGVTWNAGEREGEAAAVALPDLPRAAGPAPAFGAEVSTRASPFGVVPDGAVVPDEPVAAAPPVRRSEANYPRHSGR